MPQPYSKSSSLSQFLYQIAEKWQGVKLRRPSAQPHPTESAAWQQLLALSTDLLEVTITVQDKASLATFLTTLHGDIQHEYRFQRPSAQHAWQLVQHWNPLAC
ncbi:hypothetical protein [Hymenobacter cheonanensis]|uniref:hypothetical protein n=1 Tax=Hymenobacter sp. CA2-7 TaxID=3063993 RepID=UPI002713C2B8|nr:hypothetical protein [Hymenobacter sp. CA2-7]MDO7884503.1 hypothetical protein [Hymenobacter sp. CA2-7]